MLDRKREGLGRMVHPAGAQNPGGPPEPASSGRMPTPARFFACLLGHHCGWKPEVATSTCAACHPNVQFGIAMHQVHSPPLVVAHKGSASPNHSSGSHQYRVLSRLSSEACTILVLSTSTDQGGEPTAPPPLGPRSTPSLRCSTHPVCDAEALPPRVAHPPRLG